MDAENEVENEVDTCMTPLRSSFPKMTSFGTLRHGTAEKHMLIGPSVFVTGNQNKLREVKAILQSGGSNIEVTCQGVDGMSDTQSLSTCGSDQLTLV